MARYFIRAGERVACLCHVIHHASHRENSPPPGSLLPFTFYSSTLQPYFVILLPPTLHFLQFYSATLLCHPPPSNPSLYTVLLCNLTLLSSSLQPFTFYSSTLQPYFVILLPPTLHFLQFYSATLLCHPPPSNPSLSTVLLCNLTLLSSSLQPFTFYSSTLQPYFVILLPPTLHFLQFYSATLLCYPPPIPPTLHFLQFYSATLLCYPPPSNPSLYTVLLCNLTLLSSSLQPFTFYSSTLQPYFVILLPPTLHFLQFYSATLLCYPPPSNPSLSTVLLCNLTLLSSSLQPFTFYSSTLQPYFVILLPPNLHFLQFYSATLLCYPPPSNPLLSTVLLCNLTLLSSSLHPFTFYSSTLQPYFVILLPPTLHFLQFYSATLLCYPPPSNPSLSTVLLCNLTLLSSSLQPFTFYSSTLQPYFVILLPPTLHFLQFYSATLLCYPPPSNPLLSTVLLCNLTLLSSSIQPFTFYSSTLQPYFVILLPPTLHFLQFYSATLLYYPPPSKPPRSKVLPYNT
ncbi:hypothetical protein ACHWQZ_G008000 [Mnemiopsis leidyi]